MRGVGSGGDALAQQPREPKHEADAATDLQASGGGGARQTKAGESSAEQFSNNFQTMQCDTL